MTPNSSGKAPPSVDSVIASILLSAWASGPLDPRASLDAQCIPPGARSYPHPVETLRRAIHRAAPLPVVPSRVVVGIHVRGGAVVSGGTSTLFAPRSAGGIGAQKEGSSRDRKSTRLNSSHANIS